MTQTILHAAALSSNFYFNPIGWTFSGVLLHVQAVMPEDGTLKNLRLKAKTALTGAQTVAVTLFKNGVATGLTLTVNAASGTTTQSDTDSVSYAAGDTMHAELAVTNSPTAVFYFSIDYESSNANTAIYQWDGTHDTITGGSGEYSSFFGGGRNTGYNPTESRVSSLVSVGGSVKGLSVSLEFAPGAGQNFSFAVMKNGVAQDGSGGTTDTRLTISNTDTTGRNSFTLAVAAGDTLSVRWQGSAFASTGKLAGLTLFESGSSNRWNVSGLTGTTGLSTGIGTTIYNGITPDLGAWTTTEASSVVRSLLSGTLFFSSLRWKVQTAPGSGKSWALTFRKNSADTGLSSEIADLDTTADVVSGNVVTAAVDDTFTMKAVSAGSPADSGYVTWTLVASTASPEVIGSTVFGVSTTVTASRAAAFGLDGNTNVHSEADKLKVFGHFEYTGTGTLPGFAPSSPSYVTLATHATLTSERVLTGSSRVSVTDAGAGSTVTLDIPNDAINYGRIQNVSAASRLLGRGSAGGSGDVEELTPGSGLTLSGTTLTAEGREWSVLTNGDVASPEIIFADGEVVMVHIP